MNELLQSIKADLLSRHMLPLLVVAGVALLGALAYVALGSGGEAKQPTLPPAVPVSSGLPVAIAPPSTTAAAAETPAGVQYQTQGSTRDPFASLAGTSAASPVASNTASSTASSAAAGVPGGASSSSGTAGSGSSSGASSPHGGSTSSTPRSIGKGPGSSKQPRAPASAPVPKRGKPVPPKPEVVQFYNVSALFGAVSSGPGEQSTLTPYDNMKKLEPLPTPKARWIVFAGVNPSGGEQRAVFGLVVPAILRGSAACYPSDTDCQWIELRAGKSEELEYVNADGQAAAYELEVVKIEKRSSRTGASEVKAMQVSRAGRQALLAAGLSPLAWQKRV
jgi:hypothetical protein